MMTLLNILTHLYPDASGKELEKLRILVEEKGEEYYWRTWKEVTKEDLGSEQVQFNLIKTLYRTQRQNWGVVDEILRSLVEFSDEKALVFSGVDDKTNDFYQRYFCFLGWLNFAFLEFQIQYYLLWSRFLPLACAWDMPIYVNTQRYFERYVFVSGQRADAQLFADAIAANQTPLGVQGKKVKEIGQWIQQFDAFESGNFMYKVRDFMDSGLEIKRIDTEAQEALYKILTLYWGLRGGYIWREITDNSMAAGYPEKEVVNAKTTPEHYLEALSEANEYELGVWLSDWKTVYTWIVVTEKKEDFLNHLFAILASKINLENEAHVSNLISFISTLLDNGFALGAELIYFDEKSGSFKWNDDVVDALQAEFEAATQKKKTSIIQPAKAS